MSTPDTCPHCGAGEYPDSSPRFHTRSAGKLPWLCGTLRDTVNPVRTGRCFENELINERAAHAETRQQYMELIMAVARKFDGETRHQTALRYIKHAEDVAREAGKADAAMNRLDAEAKEGR